MVPSTVIIDKRVIIPVVGCVVAGLLIFQHIRRGKEREEIESAIAKNLQEAGQMAADVHARLGALNAEHVNLSQVTQLLGLVAVSDHGSTLTLLKEWSGQKQALSIELSKLEAELRKLEASRVVAEADEGRSALEKINNLRIELVRFEGRLLVAEESGNGLLGKLNAVVIEEEANLYEELRFFSAALEGSLNEVEAEAKISQSDVSAEASRKRALRLARLADLLYTPESLVKKKERLSKPPSTIEQVNARLKVDRDDKTYLRTDLRSPSRELLPPGTYSFAQRGSPWRVAALGLHVRTGPSARADVVCEAYQGEEVRVLRKPGLWWQVSTRCGSGWVLAKHITSR